jgi:hypothetical protein
MVYPKNCKMKDTTCNITAQYYENYGYSEGKQAWKPKGSAIFTLKVDSDFFLYEKDLCIEAIKEMLTNECNEGCRYEYIDHELQFSDPTVLDSEDFETRIIRLCEKTI